MLGTIAGLMTTGCLVPQVVKVLRTHDTSALSLGMYSIQVTGIMLWFIYGIMNADMNLIAANGVSFFLSLIILLCKLKNDVLPKKETVAIPMKPAV